MIFRQKFDGQIDTDKIKKFASFERISFHTAELLMQRGIDCDQKFQKYTNPSLDDLQDPFLLSGMAECVERIKLAIEQNQSVLIFGDYDVDGISASTILYRFLKDKISKVNCFLPNRYVDGYGLTIDSAKKVIEQFSPQLIITVDCGISCAKEVDYIKSQGIDIIVTDHHEIPEELPKTIVVDPKLPNQKYGFDGLCGAGVALKVVQAFLGKFSLDEYLPICEIATVSNIVPLVSENRAIVKLGLARQKFLPAGIKMLQKDLKIDSITSTAISFKLAPRLNAGGRMGNAYTALDLYIQSDKQKLSKSLKLLNDQNTQRQNLSQQIYEDCLNQISAKRLYEQKAIILKSDKWDSGLLGIACARLVDDFFKPVFLFSQVGDELKGSVRSIGQINIHTVLSSCSDYLCSFGGHSMAAGLSLKNENFQKFKEQIFDFLDKNTQSDFFEPVKYYDLKMNASEINVPFAKEIQILEPFGCDNPNPLFLVEYTDCIVSKMLGHDSHLNLTINKTLKCIAFNSGEYVDDYKYAERKRTIVELQTNVFKKKEYLKGIVKSTAFFGFGKNLQDLSNARQLKELYSNNVNSHSICFFETKRLDEILSNLLSRGNGTAVVVSNRQTYDSFKDVFAKYRLSHFVGGSQSKFAENCLIFALDGLDGLENYKNLVFCDGLLSKDFLAGFSGKVYCASDRSFHIQNINFDRKTFGNIFVTIKGISSSKMQYKNELELYDCVKKTNLKLANLSYAQFVVAFYTFLQLGIIKISKENGYGIQIVDGKKTNLENSKFYNQLCFLSKIK